MSNPIVALISAAGLVTAGTAVASTGTRSSSALPTFGVSTRTLSPFHAVLPLDCSDPANAAAPQCANPGRGPGGEGAGGAVAGSQGVSNAVLLGLAGAVGAGGLPTALSHHDNNASEG